MNKYELWYRRPARAWEEALPIGNGRIGAMVFGGAEEERLALNEDEVATIRQAYGYFQDTVREVLQARVDRLRGRRALCWPDGVKL